MKAWPQTHAEVNVPCSRHSHCCLLRRSPPAQDRCHAFCSNRRPTGRQLIVAIKDKNGETTERRDGDSYEKPPRLYFTRRTILMSLFFAGRRKRSTSVGVGDHPRTGLGRFDGATAVSGRTDLGHLPRDRRTTARLPRGRRPPLPPSPGALSRGPCTGGSRTRTRARPRRRPRSPPPP